MSFNKNSFNNYKRAWVAGGAALSLFGLGFVYGPAPERVAKQIAPVQVAAAPSASLAQLLPLPEREEVVPTVVAREKNAAMPPVETYKKVLKHLEDSYYTPKPVNEREVTYAAIRGMLASLGDRYTRFLDPDEFRRMQQENEGEFGGIGAKLEKVDGKTVINEVVPGTPAEKGGLLKGDAVIEVDGKNVVGTSIFKVVDVIRGLKGSPVKLTIERKGVEKPFVKTIIRDTIKLPTVTAVMLKGPDNKPNGIARIELSQFNQLAHSELDAALQKMTQQGMKGLVLDLRGNPGGLLSEAVAVASRFMDTGNVVIIERGERQRPMAVEGARLKYDGPLVVLVNKFSASASEIVAGAIKDTNRGVIVGTDTWGKGLVQTITPIQEDGSAVLITTHKYLTPNKTDINKKGIVPHFKVEMKKEDVDNDKDPQLDKAVSILQGKMGESNAVAAKKQ